MIQNRVRNKKIRIQDMDDEIKSNAAAAAYYYRGLILSLLQEMFSYTKINWTMLLEIIRKLFNSIHNILMLILIVVKYQMDDRQSIGITKQNELGYKRLHQIIEEMRSENNINWTMLLVIIQKLFNLIRHILLHIIIEDLFSINKINQMMLLMIILKLYNLPHSAQSHIIFEEMPILIKIN